MTVSAVPVRRGAGRAGNELPSIQSAREIPGHGAHFILFPEGNGLGARYMGGFGYVRLGCMGDGSPPWRGVRQYVARDRDARPLKFRLP